MLACRALANELAFHDSLTGSVGHVGAKDSQQKCRRTVICFICQDNFIMNENFSCKVQILNHFGSDRIR